MDETTMPWSWTEREARDAYAEYSEQEEQPMSYEQWLSCHRELDRLCDGEGVNTGRVRELSNRLHV